MRTVRIFFTKQAEAAYISHLDLQRVMGRALRKSGMSVWYSMGFNPHIYMSFSLPLPLGQNSLCESVDVKTESEEDFSLYRQRLSDALPAGIEVYDIAPPGKKAEEITACSYEIKYPENSVLLGAINGYNNVPAAVVHRKTKRSQQDFDLKTVLGKIRPDDAAQGRMHVQLPAGTALNINPALLAGFLQDSFGLWAADAVFTRVKIWAGAEDYT